MPDKSETVGKCKSYHALIYGIYFLINEKINNYQFCGDFIEEVTMSLY